MTMVEMEQECKKLIGGDYLRGFKPMKGYNCILDGQLEEHCPHFADIWRRYDGQLQTTNGVDLDTFPGCSMLVDAYLIRMSDTTTEEEAMMIYELVDLALEIYNHDESNLFKYKFIKVEKVNTRLTGYAEFFITVKFLNVTLATVVETFQIYAGQSMCRRHFKRVFSCVPKAGALM
ncbi:hypothetical protein R3W88_031972 [Solanum pinnatisectum]|uniref:Uncharacterized protein n=1 Tax=Solanum pinnatisectum TaxID=50273 RepID=A0AAV9LRH0_9SOLN|nr:hypothetical protein R3W88_031972 [Solanum pinnatisectum]